MGTAIAGGECDSGKPMRQPQKCKSGRALDTIHRVGRRYRFSFPPTGLIQDRGEALALAQHYDDDGRVGFA